MNTKKNSQKAEINETVIDKIANLARLSPSQEDKRVLVGEMNAVLEFVSQLNEVDTDNVAPLHNVMDMSNVFREDEPKPSLSKEEALSNAPARKGDYFAVPKVIKT